MFVKNWTNYYNEYFIQIHVMCKPFFIKFTKFTRL